MFNILAVTALSKPASVVVKSLVFVFTLPFVMDLPVDVELDMIEQGIPFTIVEEMPERFNVGPGGIAYYSTTEDMIFFVSTDGTFSYEEFLSSAVHEIIHYYRDQSGDWSGDTFKEELIACYGTRKLDTIMGMENVDLSNKEVDRWFLGNQIANNMKSPRLPTAKEMAIMDIELERLEEYILSL